MTRRSRRRGARVTTGNQGERGGVKSDVQIKEGGE